MGSFLCIILLYKHQVYGFIALNKISKHLFIIIGDAMIKQRNGSIK